MLFNKTARWSKTKRAKTAYDGLFAGSTTNGIKPPFQA
jgi:hypothetical protein